MAAPLHGSRGSISIQGPAESTAALPENSEGGVSEGLRERLSVDPQPGGPRHQPVESRSLRHLNGIIENAPISQTSTGISPARSSLVRTSGNEVSIQAQPDVAPQTPQQDAQPMLAPSPVPTQVDTREPSARVFSDSQIIAMVVNAGSHVDMQQPEPLAHLSKALALHAFDLAKMSTRDMVRLFVGVHGLGGQLTASGELRDKLTERVGQINAALVRRLGYVDIDSLKLLLKASDLSREGAELLGGALQQHLPALQAKLILSLMGSIVRAVENKSPSAISSAVMTAKTILAELDQVAGRVTNERDKELEKAMAKALGDSSLMGTPVKLQQIFLGKHLKRDKKTDMPVRDSTGMPIVQNTPNAVSRAVSRQLSGADAEKDGETANLMLLKNAVSSAAR